MILEFQLRLDRLDLQGGFLEVLLKFDYIHINIFVKLIMFFVQKINSSQL